MSERLLEQLRAARSNKQLVRELIQQASEVRPIDPRSLVDIAIIARDEGLRSEAIELFDALIADGRCKRMALYEKSVLYMHEGEHRLALSHIRGVLNETPLDTRANLLAAKLCFALCDFLAGKKCLNSISYPMLSDQQRKEVRIVGQLGRFLQRYPKEFILTKCFLLETGSKWLDVNHVAEGVLNALNDRRGYSLVRCGDGEGAFISPSTYEEAEFPDLYDFNRENRAHVWFAGSIDINTTGFTNEAFRLEQALNTADVVGLPYRGWLEHEHKILSPTGISTLTNLLMLPLDCVPNFCTQQIHVELHRSKKIYDIMRSVNEIGLISCHAQLPEMLQAKFGFKNVDYHYIPGEKGHSHLVDGKAVVGEHWPDGYHRVVSALSRPLAGRLYIVAAGILGKLYCSHIKNNGGVAIDMGSIADGWVGSATRPGLTGLEIG